MNEKSLQAGDTVTYGEYTYKVIENRITPDNKKKNKLLLINGIAIFTMILVYIICMVLIVLTGKTEGGFFFDLSEFMLGFLGIALAFIIFIVAHEYVHYLTYRFVGKTPKKDLKFGVVLKSGMAYCISLVPNTVKTSRLSLMMPFYVLVIPIIIVAIVLQSGALAFLAAIFASGSAGDFWYMWTLRKDNETDYIIEAMPNDEGYEIGYLLLNED